MEIDIATLVLVTSLVFITQTIAVFLQYFVNKTYNGLGWWLLGAVLLALGFLIMPAATVPSIRFVAVFANPLVFTGLFLLGIGVDSFFGRKAYRGISILLLVICIVSYFIFILKPDGSRGRSIIVAATTGGISLKVAYVLFREKKPQFGSSALFCSAIFFVYGLYQACMTAVYIFTADYDASYLSISESTLETIMFVVPIVCGILWTYGFIIMLNQRLNAENLEEREKMQLVFNTCPEGQLLSRACDNVLIDVNTSFLSMSGYARGDVIGKTTLDLLVWDAPSDRTEFLERIRDRGQVDNHEYDFRRRDGSRFVGNISGRVIMLQGERHILSVVQDINDRKFSEQKIHELVQQLELEKKLAELNSFTDNLTSLMNRRYFDDSLRSEFSRLRRSGAPLSLIILDIDHFKKFNDTYGHLAGDNCLRQVGSVLRIVVKRLSDVVARYGGEEFVVVMPETDGAGALLLAEKIRAGVEALGLSHESSETAACVTVSVGVVTAHPADFREPEEIISLADAALYEAKRRGRNRVIVSGE